MSCLAVYPTCTWNVLYSSDRLPTSPFFCISLLGAGIMGLCCSWLPSGFVPPVFRVPLVVPSPQWLSLPVPSGLLGLQIGTGWQSQPHGWLGLLSPVLPLQSFPFLVHCFSAWKAQPKVVIERMKDKDALKLLILLPPSPKSWGALRFRVLSLFP